MTNQTYRHGDVGIIPIESIGGEFKKRKENTLAYGEVTGHSHKILPKTIDDVVEVYEGMNGELAIKVNGIAVIVHEEHKTIEIPTGIYKIQNEREYDYYQLATRRVQD
jgi:hypothetical protein